MMLGASRPTVTVVAGTLAEGRADHVSPRPRHDRGPREARSRILRMLSDGDGAAEERDAHASTLSRAGVLGTYSLSPACSRARWRPPAISTVHAVLNRHGLVQRRHQRHHSPAATFLSRPTEAGSTSRPSSTPTPRSPLPSSTRKTPITAADLLNDRVLPFFEEHGIPLSRMLTDRGTEYCGARTATSTSSTWRSRTSTTPGPRSRARRPMASASASIRPCSTSSTGWRSARSSIARSTSCRPISMPGSPSTTRQRTPSGPLVLRQDPDADLP